MNGFRSDYRANSRADVADLVSAMRALPDADKMGAIVYVHALGLMLPRGILRLALWLIGLRGGERAKIALLLDLYRRDPEGALTLWEQTCTHVLSGKDREDRDSVGGWSQREIDLFLSCLPSLPPPNPGHRAGAME